MLTIQKNIIDELNAEWNDSEIHIIYGKSGCGKSYLAQEIIAQFQAEQSKNIAFYLQGDSLCENREYYAFKECLSDKLDKYYKKIDNKKLTSNIIKEIEYSCAITPQVRQAGNRLSGLTETAYASLLA